MYKDMLKKRNCAITVKSKDDFSELLKSIEEADKVVTSNVKGAFYKRVPAGDPDGVSSTLALLDDSQKEDIKTSGGHVIETIQGKYSLLDTGLTSLMCRYGFECQRTSEQLECGDYDALKKIADLGEELASPAEEMKLVVRAGNVLYCGSSSYAVQPPREIVEKMEEKVKAFFPSYDLKEANYTHEIMSAKYELASSGDAILTEFSSAWKRAGMPERTLLKTKPCLEVITSDAGKSSVTFVPSLDIGKKKMLLGDVQKIKHSGSPGPLIEGRLKAIVASIKTDQERMATLMGQTLDNPVQVLVAACKYKPRGFKSLRDITKKGTQELVDNYAIYLQPRVTTAFNVYQILNEIIYTGSWGTRQKSGTNILMAQEAVHRALLMDYKEFDKPTLPVEFDD